MTVIQKGKRKLPEKSSSQGNVYIIARCVGMGKIAVFSAKAKQAGATVPMSTTAQDKQLCLLWHCFGGCYDN